LQGDVQAFRQQRLFAQFHEARCGREPLKFGGDQTVVARGGCKDFASQFEPRREGSLSRRVELFRHSRIVGGIGYDRDAFKVFCGGAQHRGSADVDIFDELFRG
jgi:hypothetical protein